MAWHPQTFQRIFSVFSSSPKKSQTVPISIRPHPQATPGTLPKFHPDDAMMMPTFSDPDNERWRDAAGYTYAKDFRQRFAYDPRRCKLPQPPAVRVWITQPAPTLTGRIEAHNLKPNFVYQIKLAGDYQRDRTGFEIIGRLGRWRLPGRETNYTDRDYLDASPQTRSQTEAYILFDFFVTDHHGNAVHDFVLDASLHVIWRESQRNDALPQHLIPFTIQRLPSHPAYAGFTPSAEFPARQTIRLWAEREMVRYPSPDTRIRLTPRTYQAFLVLTEESFHDEPPLGGWWATVARLPIKFTISPP